jgi:hypothetical protein
VPDPHIIPLLRGLSAATITPPQGSTDSSHYLEKDEHRALGDLWRTYAKKGIKSA